MYIEMKDLYGNDVLGENQSSVSMEMSDPTGKNINTTCTVLSAKPISE